MEPDGSLTHSQVPAIAGLYREVAENFTLLSASESIRSHWWLELSAPFSAICSEFAAIYVGMGA
jgi:hypothetical protein